MDGNGTFYFANGDKFVGTFKNDIFIKGVYYNKDRKINYDNGKQDESLKNPNTHNKPNTHTHIDSDKNTPDNYNDEYRNNHYLGDNYMPCCRQTNQMCCGLANYLKIML
jgi:hypothetical protein